MENICRNIFSTDIGPCAIFWDKDSGAIMAFLLPDPSLAPSAKSEDIPPKITKLIKRVQKHLAGNPQDFSDVPYDWSQCTDFQVKVYKTALLCKSGSVWTYGELAEACGLQKTHSRAIGGALRTNPWPLLVPCHRFIGSSGALIGFSAHGSTATKQTLLEIEKAKLPSALMQTELF